MQSFGEWIRQERRKKNWTLQDVAKRIGSHKGYVSGIENAKVNPPSAKLCKRIARIFDADPVHLMVMSRLEKMEPAPRERVTELYELGNRVTAIAKQLGVTVDDFLRKGVGAPQEHTLGAQAS